MGGHAEHAGGSVSLLSDPLFTTDAGAFSLPGVLAASARGEIGAWARLRAHQRTAWHMFRVQLAALALDRAGLAEPPDDEAEWAGLLRDLGASETGDDGADPDGAWRLVVADRERPAFLQPPDPGGLANTAVPTPDALDLLITARNHDLKRAVAHHASAEDWAYALVSLQTCDGPAGGAGGYRGIARIPPGVAATRPFLGLAPTTATGTPDPSAWWRRDVGVLLEERERPAHLNWRGPSLLWLKLWTNGQPLHAHELHPWMIEICRRIRLEYRGSRLIGLRGTAKGPRTDSSALNGVLGDAWTPVRLQGEKIAPFSLGNARFDYKRTVDLLGLGNVERWRLPAAARALARERTDSLVVVAEALSRGNSKTWGHQSRIVPLPKRIVGLLATTPAPVAFATAEQIEEVKRASETLREAVALFAACGVCEKVEKKKPDGKPNRERAKWLRYADEPIERLERTADAAFFEHLWDRAAAKASGDGVAETAARVTFKAMLVDVARRELRRAHGAVPCASVHAPRARARSERRLDGNLRKEGLMEGSENERVGEPAGEVVDG